MPYQALRTTIHTGSGSSSWEQERNSSSCQRTEVPGEVSWWWQRLWWSEQWFLGQLHEQQQLTQPMTVLLPQPQQQPLSGAQRLQQGQGGEMVASPAASCPIWVLSDPLALQVAARSPSLPGPADWCGSLAALWNHGSCQPRSWTPGKGVRAPPGPGTNNILWGRLRPSSSLSSGGWWNSASPSHLEAPSPCRAGYFTQTREGRI
uniref:uncharacterized protein LOC120884237 n=1 Tax=Ictidomys tridecemlineatus TaxID=43179 RepID=UPI001A9D219B|nr:uncharacterized protein LOC120884237 [Ictidomys tridecemlineatus]